jgi:hypothetical protein
MFEPLPSNENAALRVDGAGQIFGVTTRTIPHWIERGDLPSIG